MTRPVVLVVALACAAALAAVLFFATRPDSTGVDGVSTTPDPVDPATTPTNRRPPRGARDPGRGPSAVDPGGAESARLVRSLAAGLVGDDLDAVRKAAATLRAKLRTDAEALQAAGALLADADAPEALRSALARVLGTIPSTDVDQFLLDALARFEASPAFVAAALAGLAAKRDAGADEEAFSAAGLSVFAGEEALSVGVRSIDNPAVRTRVEAFLAGGDAASRLAAARALRASLDDSEVRACFTAALAREKDVDTASLLGMSLAERVRGVPDADERRRIVSALLARAEDDAFESYRGAVEPSIRGLPLDRESRRRLVASAGAGAPTEKRLFALTLLAKCASATGEDAVAEIRGTLAETLAGDVDPDIRSSAALLLQAIPRSDAVVDAAARAARSDPDWSVRCAALDSLAAFATAVAAREAIVAAESDADARVAEKAKTIAGRLK